MSPTAERRGGPPGGEMRERTAVSSMPVARDSRVTLWMVSHLRRSCPP